jgi:hypothetical protein
MNILQKLVRSGGHLHLDLGGKKTFVGPQSGHKLPPHHHGAFNILFTALRDTSAGVNISVLDTVEPGLYQDFPG